MCIEKIIKTFSWSNLGPWNFVNVRFFKMFHILKKGEKFSVAGSTDRYKQDTSDWAWSLPDILDKRVQQLSQKFSREKVFDNELFKKSRVKLAKNKFRTVFQL